MLGYLSKPLGEDFESGALGPEWTTFSESGGRVRVLTSPAPHGGSFALFMDRNCRFCNTFRLNEAILTVNLSGIPSPTLSFWHAEFSEGETPFSGPFTGHFDADGVAISTDNTNWFPVFTPPSQSSRLWRQYTIRPGRRGGGGGHQLYRSDAHQVPAVRQATAAK